MLFKNVICAGIIGTGATIVMSQSIARAKTPVEIANIAKTITILISGNNTQGSGVIIQRQGDIYTVLTAAHVVDDKIKYQITTPDDRQYQIIDNVVRSAPGNIDLAVVKFRSTANYPIAKLGNSNLLQSGMDLYVAGFPLATPVLTESVLIFREGKVSANSNRSFDAGYSLVYSNDTLPGMSGGAVLNNNGELVAIHGRGDRERLNNGQFGSKTGFNVGIPINRFATVANRMGVQLGITVAVIPNNTAMKADDFIASARQKYERKDYRGSLIDLDRAIQIGPNLAIAYRWRGLLKESKLDDIQGGFADYNRAIQLDPNRDAIAYNNRGLLKETSRKDVRGALADFNRAIEIDPNLAIAYYNRGYLKHLRFQDSRGGLRDFDRAIQLDPNYANAYNNRGFIKDTKLQDVRGGLADYNRAIQLDRNNAVAYYNRGNLKANKLQDFQGGLTDYNRSIQLNPNYPNSYRHRGVLKANKLQDVRGGLADLDLAIQLKPSYADAYHVRGKIKFDLLKDRSGAIIDIKQAAKLYQQQGNTKEYQETIADLDRINVNVR